MIDIIHPPYPPLISPKVVLVMCIIGLVSRNIYRKPWYLSVNMRLSCILFPFNHSIECKSSPSSHAFLQPLPLFFARCCSTCPGCGTAQVPPSSPRRWCFCLPPCSTGARGACGRGLLGGENHGRTMGKSCKIRITAGKSWKSVGKSSKILSRGIFAASQ